MSTTPSHRAADPAPLPLALRAIVALAFVGGLVLPLARMGVEGADETSAVIEARRPSPAPELALEADALAAAPDATAAWFADRFPGRRELIRAHNRLLWAGLGVSPSDEMLRGTGDWLYFLGHRAMDVHKGLLLPDERLERWGDRYSDWAAWLAARDARYVVMLAPEKQDVHPEALPEWAGERPERTRTDQFVEELTRRGIDVVDTRAVLRAKAADELLYYPLGTHWNFRGAYLGYVELMDALGRLFPGLAAVPESAFDVLAEDHPLQRDTIDDYTRRMFLDDVADQPLSTFVQRPPVVWRVVETWFNGSGGIDGMTTVDEPRLPRVVLLRDSFGNWIWPFLANHARRLVSQADVRFDVALVEREAPDLVVTLRVERLLTSEITELELGRGELDAARAWNQAEPVPLAPVDGGWSAGDQDLEPGDGVRGTWIRLEREVGRARDAVAKSEPFALRLTDAEGSSTRVAGRWPAGRRWHFAWVPGTRSPVRIEVLEEAAAPASVSVRVGSDVPR